MLHLEAENMDTGDKSTVVCADADEADRILSERGYERLGKELCWAGKNSRGHEISVMEVAFPHISTLHEVNDKVSTKV